MKTNKIRQLVPCACGLCDEMIYNYDKHWIARRYKNGHASRVDPTILTRPVKERTSRQRAKDILMKSLKKTKCETESELCNGRLEAHHIDKNPFNNNLDNLILLCATHHNFADIKNLSREQLKNLKLKYYISSNKRRYYEEKPEKTNCSLFAPKQQENEIN